MKEKPGFFDFAAEVGLTKHIGSLDATDKLAALCQITRSSDVLDVGCGVGVTPCYLAKQYGCRVVGVDILEKMVERSKEQARRDKVLDRTEFCAADAQDLPFENDLFDVVITESVTAFPADKQRAVNEYARVVKPGGYVGLNETIWLKEPVPPEIIAWVSQDRSSTPMPQTHEAWIRLLEQAGLEIISAEAHSIDTKEEARGMLARYGLGGILRVLGRTLRLYLRSADYRQFVSSVHEDGILPDEVNDYFGYGLYVGRKKE